VKCRACGKQARKTRVVLLLGADRGLRGTRVCAACADGGATVVASRIAPVVIAARAERRAQAEVLAPFVALFKAQAAALRACEVQDEDQQSFVQGKVDALEGVVEVLKRGRA
jgi:hypothetical protein